MEIMISHKHKFIFVHIPKCGGTTIEKFFLDKDGVDCDWSRNAPLGSLSEESKKKYRLEPGQHAPFNSFQKEFKEKYFSFTFARNPWSKMVSEWAYFYEQKDPITFKEFTQRMINPDHNNKHPYSGWHFKSQHIFSKGCKFIGRFESLQKDFNHACDKIKIPRQELPHENKSKHKHYTDYYDNETREIVAEKYAEDIEYFGYKFGE